MVASTRALSIALAVLLIAVLLRYWVLVEGLFRIARTDPWSQASLLNLLVVGLFLGLLIASIVGLLKMRIWGIYAIYALVPVSTVLHGIALVPFVSGLLPTQLRIGAVFVLNLAFLGAALILHRSWRKRLNSYGSSSPAQT
jgi:hypothetical protein